MKRLACIALLGVALAALLQGCSTTVSAYGGETNFKCAARFEEGVPCDSISGTATNYSAGNLKWQQKDGAAATPAVVMAKMQEIQNQPPILGAPPVGVASGPAIERLSPRQMPASTAGMPLRIPERVLRIWVAPFEDEEGALNDQKYVYLTVQKGAWQVETNKLSVPNTYKQIQPLGRAKQIETEPVDQRATAKIQAKNAIANNPNITNLPAQSTGVRGAPRDEDAEQ